MKRPTGHSRSSAARRPFKLRKGVLLLLVVGLVSALSSATALARQDVDTITVTVDIKPGDEPTVMDPRGEGMIPVAVLSDENFDAVTIDPASVRFGANGDEAAPVRTITEDIDQDGDTDLMFLFRAGQANIRCGDTSATLSGRTRAGRAFSGSESFQMEGCDSRDIRSGH
ncbi:MAG: hypothetical protein IH849_02805 [Acidobacteria bacterium]|nr:hypothetical protein [Acidobacteriota bacterium]